MSQGGDGLLGAFVEQAVASGTIPGAVALVAEGERVLACVARGDAQTVPTRDPIRASTPFDLASLTKPLVTALLLHSLGPRLDLNAETPVRALLPELDSLDHADIRLWHLLSHSSGLPAWRPLFLRSETAPGYLRTLRSEALVGLPGRRVVYSDPGFMAAGEMLVRAAGVGLDALFREVVSGPLQIGACFNPPPAAAGRAAATEVGQRCERRMAGEEAQEYGGWREGTIRGEVHDHHAWVAGGVLGSAGLFGTAGDVHRLALEFLGEGRGLLSGTALDHLRTPVQAAGEAWSLGLAVNRDRDGSGGPGLPPAAFGHTGFTGTSVWIDPERRRIYVLLTNRVHPEVRQPGIRELRREFHRIAAEI